MSDLPFMPLWVAKYDARTMHLSLEEDGAYMRLLRLCWVTPGQRLVADDAWIARMLRVPDEATYDRVVKRVLREFFYKERGYWKNARLTQVWDAQSRISSSRSAAGKKGAQAKHQKTQGPPSGKATGKQGGKTEAELKQPEPESITKQASKLALGNQVRDCLGPRAANTVKDGNVDAVVAEWLAMGATEAEILEVVQRKTSARDQAPIRSLRALNADIGEVIANRRQPAPPPKFLDVPPGKAGECVAAIIRRHGQDRATAWLAGATWSDGAVVVASEFDRQRVDGDFGEILRAYEFDVEVAPPAKKTA